MSIYKPKKFADMLVWCRVENDYSQEDLADIIGITVQTLKKWESGKANTRRFNIKIKRAFILIQTHLEFKLEILKKLEILEMIENEGEDND